MEVVRYGAYEVVSQNPNIAKPNEKFYAEKYYLPELLRAWKHIEQVTGYRWKSTSYWRDSPSHKRGVSLDIAPDISPASEKFYAVTNGSDPVLYKRLRLLRALQQAARTFPIGPFQLGVFIEPDHLHIQVLKRGEGDLGMRIIKWKVPKAVYGDTYERMRLPLIV